MGKKRSLKYKANDNDAFNPELWAKYSVAILLSNMVAGNLVYRDFEDILAKEGDVVNTRKPASFVTHRKGDDDSVTIQDAKSTNIAVKLNMHPHVSFMIKDGEESKSFLSLVEFYLDPAVKSMAEHIDACILGQFMQYITNGGQAGKLAGLTSSNYQAFLSELGERMDDNKVPASGRNLIVSPKVKKLLLQNQTLVGADQRGDEGTALREAWMGRIYGFDHYMCQNMSSFSGADEMATFKVNNAAGYSKGDTVLTVDTGSGAVATGNFVKIGGKVYRITAHAETAGDTTSMTLSPGLWEDVADNDDIVVYDEGAVNLAAGYAVGYDKAIKIDGFTIFPKVGQGISFGSASDYYTIIARDTTANTISLDRPLEAAIADDDAVNITPPGDYGLGFTRESLALVVRPLALPRAGAGAISGSLSYQGFNIRVVITYDGEKQGHLVTIDCLMGLKVLDDIKGAVLLA